MRRSLTAIFLVTVAAQLWAQTAPPAPGEARSVSALAADSLTNSAVGLAMTPGAHARGTRLIILAESARELYPDHQAASRILADVYLVLGDSAGAAQMLRTCLDTRPDDYSLWMQWLASSLSSLQTAETRLAFLDGVIRDEALAGSVRAEAVVRYADVLLGRGDRADAEQLFTTALTFDPYNPGALQGWVDVQETISVVDSANVMFRMLRGSPLDANIAHDIGVLMGSLGLWKDALKFFDYAWALAVRDVGVEAIPHDWMAEYANALVDAGQIQRTVDIFTPLLEQYPDSADLLSLLAEANLGLGRMQETQELVDRIEAAYRPGTNGNELRSYDIEMAMFYLTTKPDSRLAMAHARGALHEAGARQAASVVLQRLLGGAELAAGSTESGLQRLTNIQDGDIYASVFLASHYFASGRTDLGAQAVLTGAKVSRSGPAFRQLEAMARQNGVSIPLMAGASQISQMARSFNDLYLQMGLHPERFVEVSFVKPDQPYPVGQPIEITLLLRNVGPLPIPIGIGGLFEPAVAIQVELAGPWEQPIAVTDLPLAAWPAPQRITPDQTVRCEVRLDVGQLADILAANPLSDLHMTVSGVLDPIQRENDLQPLLTDISIEPVTVTRASLMDLSENDDADRLARAYQAMMAAIASGSGALDAGLRAQTARQVGSLRVLLARMDAGEAQVPSAVPVETMRSELVQLQKTLLDDESYLVRAEMIHSLRLASVADRAMVLPRGVDDPSPMVRLRTAELLGTMDDLASRQMLAQLANDPYPLVAETASVFLPSWTGPGAGDDTPPATPASPEAPTSPDDTDQAEPVTPAEPPEPTAPPEPATPAEPAEPATPPGPADPTLPAEPPSDGVPSGDED